MKTWTVGTLLVLTPVLLSACANMPSPPAEEEAAIAAVGYGRAFGRFEYVQKDKATVWSASNPFSDTLTLFVRSAETGEMQYMYMDGEGLFNWPLRSGNYEIVGYHIVRKGTPVTRLTSRLMGAFSVPRAGQAVYIGDLRVDADRRRVDVLDRYEDALKHVEAKLAAGKFEAVKALMRLEQRTGNYAREAGICNPGWGLTCDRSLQGVEPLRPEGTTDGFPIIPSLRPLLEWKPGSRIGVSYDVAIYESLSFKYGGSGSVSGLRGTLVAYAEGLREPRYTPDTPLQPGKRYEWTVRLRDGDTVSTWSATSYEWFAVVAWKRGSGRGFGFETPEK